ncbi:orotate phosphoribosyltransferase [Dellaglioa sp. P0083]|uniref:orotate phosphoribosyltransferase n=1 Tax=Dellaglioa kimchii TaxID=3344667 RepID=UPI0038D3D2F5
MNLAETVASDLLEIGAVTLSPKKPFIWASGLKSPIYCDNRLTISYPEIRTRIAKGIAGIICEKYPDTEVIAGTATAGIPHAAWIANELNLPLIYVRTKPKDHGTGQQIEGRLIKGQKTILIDDLISTGGSVIQAVNAAKNEGADVLGVIGIFSYELAASTINFAEIETPFETLTNYSTLIKVAKEQEKINSDEKLLLDKWRINPSNWL